MIKMLSIIVYIISCIINILVITIVTLSYTTNLIEAFDLIELIIIALALGYFDYIILEKAICSKRRKSFKYVIHVNGIRGKSTTTRLIDAGFRGCGFKVFSKTTGTLPYIINTENNDIKIKRLGNANIREQIKMINKAYKEQAEVLILECMAVNPELQYISEHHILHADATIITNIRLDHIQDMGEDLEDIAYAFCNTIPTNGHLIINESEYIKLFEEYSKKLNTKCHIAEPYKVEDTFDTFAENIAVALELAKALNLDVEKFYEGMKKYHHDFGAFKKIRLDNTIFLNGFSINDPESIKVVYNEIIKQYDANKLTILLNSRSDRPTRVLQHIELLKNLKCKKILLFGSNPTYVKNQLKGLENIEIETLNKVEDLNNEELIFAIGNIGGKGMEIIEYFQNNGEEI